MTTFEVESVTPMSDRTPFDPAKAVADYRKKKSAETPMLTQAMIDRRDDSKEPQGNAWWRIIWRHRNGR